MTVKRAAEDGVQEVDAILAEAGLAHGRRASRGAAWKGGERTGVGSGAVRVLRQGRRAETESVVRVAGWERMRWLRHGFSTRLGGVSTVYGDGAVGELNLGWTTQDDAKLVAENRRRFLQEVGSGELVTLRQIHSGMVRVVGRDFSPQPASRPGDPMRGDGMMTDVPGLLLGVQTADCVPVLVVDTKRRAVAAFHAGWRGTLARIVERGVGRMRMEYGSRVEDLVAAVGPAIGPCCYAVGEEVRHEFTSQFAYAEELFREVYDSDPVRTKYPLLFLTARAPGHSPIGPQMHVDLWEANRRQLLDAGLKAKNIAVVGECSSCATMEGGGKKYFSHRGESGFAGRMIGVVGVAAAGAPVARGM